MSVEVPDELRDEVLRMGESSLSGLKYDTWSVMSGGADTDAVEASVVAAGWTDYFAAWYVRQLYRDGIELDVYVPELSIYERDKAEYELELAERMRQIRKARKLVVWGWVGMLAAVGIMFANVYAGLVMLFAMFCVASTGNSSLHRPTRGMEPGEVAIEQSALMDIIYFIFPFMGTRPQPTLPQSSLRQSKKEEDYSNSASNG